MVPMSVPSSQPWALEKSPNVRPHVRTARHAPWGRRLLGSLWFEITLSWRFNTVDLTASVAPGMVAAVAAWRSLTLPYGELSYTLLRSLVYFWLFLSVHTLSAQAFGAEADRVNKPHRPIPMGLVTVRGTLLRLLVAIVLFLAVGFSLGVLGWTVLWLALVGLRTYRHLTRYWYVKNAVIVGGAIALLAAAWQMSAPITSMGWHWIMVGAAYWLLGFIQDLRDMAGDRAVVRRTLPLLLGEWPVRVILVQVFVFLPLWVHTVLLPPGDTGRAAMAWDVVFAAASWYVAFRVLYRRTARADALTYQIYCSLWCWLIAGPIFTL